MTPPKVFISYSHDSEPHKQWVMKLAGDLRTNGVEAILDVWEVGPGGDVTAFMERAVTTADRVIVICTPRYVQKANAGEGGVGYEKMIVTAELVKNLGTSKFIPITRNSQDEKQVPIFLGARIYVDFDDDEQYGDKLTELLRELHQAPASPKPPVGPNPFLHQSTASVATVETVAQPLTFDSTWIDGKRGEALADIRQVDPPGRLEIALAIQGKKLAATQAQLLDAARRSTIHTFGWPIGVVLENRGEFRPKPRQDGIVASIPIKERQSFDYWALRTNGDFYLLKSLFEDTREEKRLFFDTRIVRTTEVLLYCRNLYTTLGVSAETAISVRTQYDGLRGRLLSSANPNRTLFEGRVSQEDAVSASVTCALGEISQDPVPLVKTLLAPVFMLFDFFELSDEVYADIVNKFVNGQV